MPHAGSGQLTLSQVRVAACLVIGVVAASILAHGLLSEEAVTLDLIAVGAVTVVATAVEWDRHRSWALLVPLADIVAIGWLSWPDSAAGLGLLLVVPAYWLAQSFPPLQLAIGSAAVGIALWLPRLWHWVVQGETPPAVIGSVATTVVLIGTVAMTYGAGARVAGQHRLLMRQAAGLEAAVARARQSSQLLQQILDAVDFGVVGFEVDGTVVSSNEAVGRLLDVRELPMSDLPMYGSDGVTPVPHDAFPQLRALRGERVENVVYWIGHPGEERHALTVTVRPVHNDGRVDRMVLVARDVTAEIRAVRARDDLVASVSHELRTPLSSIMGFLDLALEEESLDGPVREMVETAAGSAERMLALINDMLAAQDGRNRQMVLSIQPTELGPLLRQAALGIRPQASDRMITITNDVLDGLVVDADPLRLRQIVDNLLLNAVKYNREGGTIGIHARTVVRPGGDGVAIDITDTGRGMTPDEQRGLFQRFYRADSVRGSTIHGSGLGLSIVRDLVERQGGEVEVRSEAGEGSTFTVILPKHDEETR